MNEFLFIVYGHIERECYLPFPQKALEKKQHLSFLENKIGNEVLVLENVRSQSHTPRPMASSGPLVFR
jgi:hypothetical protein